MEHLNDLRTAAKKLNMTVPFLDNLMVDGHIEFIVVGRRAFISNAAINKFIETIKG